MKGRVMNSRSMYPLAVAYMCRRGQDACFLTLRDEITLHGCGEDCEKILRECMGHKTLAQVMEGSGLAAGVFGPLFSTMLRQQLVVDAPQSYVVFHRASEYPSLTRGGLDPQSAAKLAKHTKRRQPDHGQKLPPCPASDFLDVLQKRKSERHFVDKPFSDEELSGLLGSMYGNLGSNSTVPSAGGIYPLHLVIALLRPTALCRAGVYDYEPESNALVPREAAISPEMASMLLDSRIPMKAAAVVFVIARMDKPVRKYANRAYRFVLMEAGHVAQNAYLYCASGEIGVVECGAFNDSEVERVLRLGHASLVLTTLVVGKADGTPYVEPFEEESWKLRSTTEKIGGLVKQIRFNTFRRGKYLMPRYAAYVEYSSADPLAPRTFEKYNRATGCGLTLHEATVKALSEAVERRSTGLIRIDAQCKRTELGSEIIDLCEPAPFRVDYLKSAGLCCDKPGMVREWVSGKSLISGGEVFSPIDQIFYPLFPGKIGRPLTYHGSSTGVAAHFEKMKAVEAGFLELIERDAIAVSWYSKRMSVSIIRDSWEPDLNYHVTELEKGTRSKVRFIDLTLDSVPVVMCVITSDHYPHLVTGSSAALTYEVAMSKSLDEAELMFHTLKGKNILRRPQSVKGVMDHARLWANREWATKLDWMWSGGESSLRNASNHRLKEVQLLFRPAVFEFGSQEENAGLHVVRVVSPVLMPITFGYGAEHYRHPRLSMLGFKWEWSYPATPHCLA